MNRRNEIFQLTLSLLASGHYTCPPDVDNGDPHPDYETINMGENWKEEGEPRRVRAAAIYQAEQLWNEFNKTHPEGELRSEDTKI